MIKKISILVLILFVGTTLVLAQSNKQVHQVAPKAKIEQDRFEKGNPSNNNLPHNANAVLIGKMWNGYATQASYTNQISTDPFSGLIGIIKRSDRTGLGSGRIMYQVSDDGGANWTPQIGPMNIAPFNAGRHPNIAIANPNQDPNAGVQAVAAGWADLAASWRYLQFSVDQSVGATQYTHKIDSVFLVPDEMFTNINGHIFETAEYDGVENPVVGSDTLDYMLFKSTDLGATWTTTVINKTNEVNPGGLNGAKGFINKNGIGYVIIEAQNANGVYNIAYKKTTDHGATWSSTWTWVDFYQVPGLQGKVHSLNYEVDMVVDADGRFHFGGTFIDTAAATDFTGIYHVYGFLPTLEAKLVSKVNTTSQLLAGGLTTLNEIEFATDKDAKIVVMKFRDKPDTASASLSDLYITSWKPGQTSYTVTNLTNTPAVNEKYSQMSAWGFMPDASTFRVDILYTIFGNNDQTDTDESELWYLYGVTFPVSDVSDNTPLVNSFELKQNYPNPFNPSTEISYTLANSGLTTLKVYNAMGQEVATLVNDVQKAGTHKVKFNASKLSSGVYMYTLTSGGFTSSKKMMLVK